MKNLVGDHLPSDNEIAKLEKAIEDVVTKLTPFTVKLTPEERRGTLKFRPGGERVVQLVADLTKKYKLDDTDTPVDGMIADLALSQRLASLARVADLLAQLVDDTTLEAQSECWQAATALYSQLSLRARNNAQLATELAEATAFFASKRTKAAATATSAGGAATLPKPSPTS